MVLLASRDRVWESLSRADQLAAWFDAAVDMDLRIGGGITFRWADGLERAAVIEELDPDRRLGFRWLPFVRLEGEPRPVPPGRVEFVLEDTDGGTALTVTEWTSWPATALVARQEWPGPHVAGSFR